MWDYLKDIKHKHKNVFYPKNKNITITPLNCNYRYLIHHGCGRVSKILSPFLLSLKIGELVKTRKPAFFRPKRKKNK